MDNECWYDIGATEYDRYEDRQAVMNDLYAFLPISHTPLTLTPPLALLLEDVPF